MEKEYCSIKECYSIVKKYDHNPFASDVFSYCGNFYHGYIFRKDEDGPTLIYDAVFTKGTEALEDLERISKALNLNNLIKLGIFSSPKYEEIIENIFKN